MKKPLLKILSLTLAAALALAPVAAASQALGTEIHTTTIPLAKGTDLTMQSLWSSTFSDLRTEQFMTYTPTQGIRPVVAYGDKLTTRATLSDMAATLEAQGKRVLGGVNGDYYVLSTGAPLGMVVTDSILRSSPQYTNSWGLGFQPDGTAFISQPELSVTANFKGMTLSISGGINKVRTAQGGYYLLTEDFATTSLNTSPGVDVILRPLSENLGQPVQVDLTVTESETPENTAAPAPVSTGEAPVAESEDLTSADVAPVDEPLPETISATLTQTDRLAIGGRVTCEVVQVLQSTGKIDLPKDCFVLTINKLGDPWLVEQLATLTPGERMDIDLISQDTRWNESVTAIGGMYKLVSDSVVNEGLDKERAPRSAVGVRPDGSAVFYSIDGRQPGHSVGATLTQVAERLVELGCVEAICLDGGGSTTFGTTFPDANALTVINRPSDGSQRANSNALFLVSDLAPTGSLDHFYLSPADTILLAGSSTQLKAQGIDTHYFPTLWNDKVDWSVKSGDGTVTADGLFTAGGSSATATVTATSGTQATGTATLTVISTPDTVRLTDEVTGAAITELMLEPNQTLNLKGVATYKNLTLTSQDTSYVWAVDPSVGTVDESGLFTAAAASGKGYLTVSAGGRSTTVPVSVTGHILPLEDFEESVTNLIGTQSAQAESNTNLDYVRFGGKSAKVTYDAISGTATLAATLPIKTGERYLTLWVYGDGSGNALMASAADKDGNLTDLVLTGLDFTGWKRVTAQLPAGTTDIRGFSVIYGGSGPVNGTLWLDQLSTANEAVTDEEAPTITMTAENGLLTATVTDAMDKNLQKKNISVLLDGQPLNFTWTPETAKVTATLPMQDGLIHRISLSACDASGNRTQKGASYSGPLTWQEPFRDMGGHWAQGYTGYLWQEEIVRGVQTEFGLDYQPEKVISRGEFALMVARWQNLDLTAYDQVELPFADAAQIPAWMLPAIKAMYVAGVMKGSMEGDLLYARAEASISRMEAMTILGRIQVKGFPLNPLPFVDADLVPIWALPHVQALYSQGVVGGYENKLNPTQPIKRGEVAKLLVSLI